MPGRDNNTLIFRNIPQSLHPGIRTSLLQINVMRLRRHEVKHDPDNPDGRIKVLKTIQHRSHGISRGLCVKYQHNGNPYQLGNLRTTPFHPVIPVKQPHHAFRHTDITRRSISGIQLLHMCLRCHVSIQIHGFLPRGHRMMFRIYIIRSALKRLYLHSPIPQQSQQT